MFFDEIKEIPKIAQKTGFSIFVTKNFEDTINNFPKKITQILEPEEKTNKINIESVRNFINLTNSKQSDDKFFIIKNPETMNQEAANAFLKSLEEPKENYHFIFLTQKPSELLKTILSRAQIFFQKSSINFNEPINVPETTKSLAKRLMTCKESELPTLAKEIADKKDRNFVIEVISTAINMSYKTFFITKNPKFLQKLPNLIKLHENITKNGNIKLHIVADML